MKHLKISLKVSILFVLTIIVGCSYSVYIDLLQIDKGMNVNDVNKILLDSDSVREYIGEEEDIIQINDRELKKYGKVTVIVKKLFNPIKEPFFAYAFVDDKLVFWGYPQDFSKENDEMLNKIGKAIAEFIWEYENS